MPYNPTNQLIYIFIYVYIYIHAYMYVCMYDDCRILIVDDRLYLQYYDSNILL